MSSPVTCWAWNLPPSESEEGHYPLGFNECRTQAHIRPLKMKLTVGSGPRGRKTTNWNGGAARNADSQTTTYTLDRDPPG